MKVLSMRSKTGQGRNVEVVVAVSTAGCYRLDSLLSGVYPVEPSSLYVHSASFSSYFFSIILERLLSLGFSTVSPGKKFAGNYRSEFVASRKSVLFSVCLLS